MNTTEQELRQLIWANPTDHDLLRVYADFLANRGDLARAEYIQLSLLDQRTQAQERRCTARRNKHRGTWLGDARPYVWTWEEDENSPGFVGRCQCQMTRLTAGFEHVRALGPRLIVSVTAPRAKREVAALAKLPVGTLWGLGMFEADGDWLTDDLMVTLAPALRGLRVLELHAGEARASERGWRALLDHLDTLERLELTMGDDPQAWLRMLVERRLPALRELSVPGWIDESLRARLVDAVPHVKFREGERRVRFNRATGFYESD